MIVQGKTDGWLSLPIDTLPIWAAFNNVQFNAIKIGPIPGLEHRGSTVVAKRQLQGGHEDPLMTIPRDLILSLERIQEHAKADSDFRAVLEGLGDFGRVGFHYIAHCRPFFIYKYTTSLYVRPAVNIPQALTSECQTARGAILSFLLMQSSTACPLMTQKRGVSTPFTEYVKYLPAELLPTFWNDAERELLKGTTLAPALAAKLNSLYREFEQLRVATSDIPWCVEAWWDEVDGILSFDDWLQVDAMYRSRALEYPGVGDCMVPCIDMANHSSGHATAAIYEVDDQGNAVLLLRDDKHIESDGEITITYGDEKGACEMIFSYGFVEDSMDSARELFLGLSIPDDDPLSRPKAIVADCPPGFKILETETGISWEGDYIWLICVNEEDGLEFKIQQTVDGNQELVATWKGHEMRSFSNMRDILQKEEMWDIFQLRAVSILQDRVAGQLTKLYGCEDSIQKIDHGEGTNIREQPWQLAMKLRGLEGELLEKAYGFFEDMVRTRRPFQAPFFPIPTPKSLACALNLVC